MIYLIKDLSYYYDFDVGKFYLKFKDFCLKDIF